ncbi:MAG: type I-B CRISPR-associated protein Cas5 [Lewinellaceae bacterium]|nr:type I-B CRISPR-associated protein Cas5 [Lewinellaceae bacterium]
MTATRVDISAWTASFRYPNLISGVQPTLEVPPMSTVLGLLNAAAGRYLQHENLQIGYYFEFDAKAEDLETTYQITSDGKGNPSNEAKSNIMRREFLFDVRLSLYLTDERLIDALKQPVFPLLLGRSGDLATIERIEPIELQEVTNASKIKGQIVPLAGNFLPGKLQALPRYFTDTFPRQNLGTEPFSIIRFDIPGENPSKLTAWRDWGQGKGGVDIFFHQFNLAEHA